MPTRHRVSAGVGLFALVALGLSGCHHSNFDSTLLESATTDTGVQGLKLHLPKGWAGGPNGSFGFAAHPASPDYVGSTPCPATLAALSVSSNGLDLATAVAQGKAALSMMFKRFEVTEDRETKIGDLPAHILGGVMTLGTLKMRVREFLFIKGASLYTLSMGSAVQYWDKYDRLSEACAQSVEL